MILTSMYTANLTANLTLDQIRVKITNLKDLLKQREYSWGLVHEEYLASVMLNHEDREYREVAEKAVKINGTYEGVIKEKVGGFVFIEENSFLEYNLGADCQTEIIRTGKFANHWAFGIQVNSPYEPYINKWLLRYREEGWLTDKYQEWFSGDNKAACSSLGKETKFGIPILAGLFLILGVGTLLSFVAVLLEMIYVAYKDNIKSGKGFTICLKSRICTKYMEIKEEWFPRMLEESIIELNELPVEETDATLLHFHNSKC